VSVNDLGCVENFLRAMREYEDVQEIYANLG